MDNPAGKKKEKPQAKAGKEEVELPIHPLIPKLIPSPDAPPDAVVLTGYLGPSPQAENVRFYLDLSFQTYFEIPKSGVLHADAADASDESKPTKIVIEASTKLDLVHTLEASYLKGAIASAHPAGANAPMCPLTPKTCVAGPPPPVTRLPCLVVSILTCPSVIICPL